MREASNDRDTFQGHRIYPDFIFATADGTDPPRLIVLESKGEHLSGNDDSNYKEAFLDHMTESLAWDETPSSSELELVEADGTVVVCKLLSNNKFEESIGGIISGAPDAKRSWL